MAIRPLTYEELNARLTEARDEIERLRNPQVYAAQLDRDLKAALARTAPNPEQAALVEQAEGIAEYLDRRHEDAVEVGGVTLDVRNDEVSFKYDLVGMGPPWPAYEVIVRPARS